VRLVNRYIKKNKRHQGERWTVRDLNMLAKQLPVMEPLLMQAGRDAGLNVPAPSRRAYSPPAQPPRARHSRRRDDAPPSYSEAVTEGALLPSSHVFQEDPFSAAVEAQYNPHTPPDSPDPPHFPAANRQYTLGEPDTAYARMAATERRDRRRVLVRPLLRVRDASRSRLNSLGKPHTQHY